MTSDSAAISDVGDADNSRHRNLWGVETLITESTRDPSGTNARKYGKTA
jgi:hypothetical protein